MIDVPEVHDLAHDDTEEARDELVAFIAELEYELTFLEWCEEEIFIPCDVLRKTIDNIYNLELPRLAASEAKQKELLASLKALEDDDGLTDEAFAVLIG